MGIDLYITSENLIPKLDISNKNLVIETLLRHVAQKVSIDVNAVYKILMERESKKNSGCGKQIAILHTVNPLIPEMVVILCTLKTPVQWESKDGKTVETVGVILSPPRFVAVHLEMAMELSKILANDTTRASLTMMNTSAQMMTVINSVKRDYA